LSTEDIEVRHNRKPKNFIRYLIDERGGPDFIIDTASSVTSFAGNFWKSNKIYQSITKTIKYTIPAYVLTNALISTYKDYRDSIDEFNEDSYTDKISSIKEYLGVESFNESTGTALCQIVFSVGSDVTNWLFTKPNTKDFSIKGFYDIEGTKVMDLFSLDQSSLYIPIEYAGSTFVWDFNFTRYEKEMSINDSTLHFLAKDHKKSETLKSTVFKEFMDHFDIENNVLNMKSYGLSYRPRHTNIEEVNQFDVDALATEIVKVLERGLKRGYVFVGVPGVGKSTIIRKLEEVISLKKYPFIYLDESCMYCEGEIKETFSNLRNIQPFIAVLEDADSCGLERKNSKLGVFLNEVDSVNRNLNGVIIMTVNDTSLVHYTVINRPGRFDEVVMVMPPRTNKEVFEVLLTQYNKRVKEGEYLKGVPFITYYSISKKLLGDIRKKGYTQADICEVLDKALLINETISNESLTKAYKNLVKSKIAIKECDFRDLEPAFLDTKCAEEDSMNKQVVYPDGEVHCS
jgi:hypothetical protein